MARLSPIGGRLVVSPRTQHGFPQLRSTIPGLLLACSGLLAAPALAQPYATGKLQPDSLSVYKATANSTGQDIRPYATQSDPAGFDGGMTRIGGGGHAIDLFHGTPQVSEVDIALACQGPGVVIARSFNGVQNAGSSPLAVAVSSRQTSNGFQGKNWFQNARPELINAPHGGGGTAADDRLYLAMRADYVLEFKRATTSSTTFLGVNGTQGAIVYSADGTGTPGLYEYRDLAGYVYTFFDFDGDAYGAQGQLWKVTDVDGSGTTAYVGHATNISTALSSSGFVQSSSHPTARPSTMYDSSGRRYTFTYTTVGSVDRIDTVVAAYDPGGGYVTVQTVDYDYYTTDVADEGLTGSLKTVTVTTPLSPTSTNLVKTTFYRYYTSGSYNSSTNPGHPSQIKLVVGPEGVRKYGAGYASATDAQLKSYSLLYAEYDSDARISKAFFNGECGCGGAGTDGEYTFDMDANGSFSDTSGIYDCSGNWAYTDWATRNVVVQPDGIAAAYYFDEAGQSLGMVRGSTGSLSSGSFWATKLQRDSLGRIAATYTPASLNAYTHSTGATAIETATGLCTYRSYDTQAGGGENFLPSAMTVTEHSKGSSGTKYRDMATAYNNPTSVGTVTFGDARMSRPFPSSRYSYFNEVSGAGSSTDYDATTYTYTFYSSSWRPQITQVTNPIVTTTQNGPNSATSSYRYTDGVGRTIFTKDEAGIYTYMAYDSYGRTTDRILDVSNSDSGINTVASGYSLTLPGAGLHHQTSYAYDPQGRVTQTTLPSGRFQITHYTVLNDGRAATVSSPKVSSNYYSPASYSVTNLAGKTEASGVLSFSGGSTGTGPNSWVDESSSDVVTAVTSPAVLSQLSSTEYDDAGTQAQTANLYHAIPGSYPGSSGTHYDQTTFGYDNMGRKVRTEDATGTVTKTTYDTQGRASASYLGTDDSGGGGDDMTKVAETEYDSGGVGNSYVTKRTGFVENSTTDRRDTTYALDYRGRTILAVNPQAPHTVMSYDNRGRVLTVSQYSSSSGLSASTDPVATTSNRVARSDTAYDARGRVYKSTRHEINQSNGASSSTLDSKTWYDAVGRTLKTHGTSITKTEYDRIGRAVRTFTLGKTNDSGYTDADDVAGDIVMEESHTTYDDLTSDVKCRATVWRHPNESDSTTGALYANTPGTSYSYSDITGRISLTAMYYDVLDRMVDTVAYGTAGITASSGSWSRPGSAASRSGTALRTTYTFTDDGLNKDVTDPRALTRRTVYDAARRTTATISNYVNGSPSSTTGADDNFTRFVYTSGLMTQMWVDLDGDNVQDADDQVTTYTYGVARGSLPDSKVASGRLLQKVAYPDSAGGSDVVSYAYNSQGQQYWKKDQAGNEITTYFDTAGRETSRRVTALAGGFDDYVQRIDTAYLSRGLVNTVTQYDDDIASNVRDQIQYSYDNWGNITAFTQDPDSVIGGSGQTDYAVAYSWSASTPSDGVNTWRIATTTLPGSFAITANYGAANSLADKYSRVSSLSASVTLATYSYMGAAQVADTVYDQPGVESGIFDGSGTTYPDWDNFNRTTKSDWLRVGITSATAAYFDARISYDENSNITKVLEPLYVKNTTSKDVFDVAYTNDDLNRLTGADQGHWTGSAINDNTNYETWSLTQTGNWANYTIDADKSSTVNVAVATDAAPFADEDDTRNPSTNFNTANEYIGSVTKYIGTGSGSTTQNISYSSSYDAVGNLINDQVNYLYKYDAFGRLMEVKTQGSALVSEYRYNGLGHRIGWHYNTDADATVENSADDPWYWTAYNEKWQEVATYIDGDADPKQRVIHNQAGLTGTGGSSYIDSVILTDTHSGAWNSSSNGTLAVRRYLLQNWRSDVVATTTDDGSPYEYVRYSPYGVPTSYPAADANRDMVTDATDENDWLTVFGGGSAPIVINIDTNKDDLFPDTGDFDFMADEAVSGKLGGYNKMGMAGAGPSLRFAYAGYAWDPAIKSYHVRHRVYSADMGRWLTRDPLTYADSSNLIEFVHSSPVASADDTGLLQVLNQSTAREANIGCGGCDARFVFMLSNRSRCEGYIVQHNENVLGYVNNDTNETVLKIWDFWEAWHVTTGSTTSDIQIVTGSTDQVQQPSVLNTWGGSHVSGDIKFFCKKTTGNLEILWGPNTPDRDPTSGILPSSRIRPAWWERESDMNEGRASRGVNLNWTCGNTLRDSIPFRANPPWLP